MFPINQVLQGDCTRVLRMRPNEVVDFVVTDPPYGMRYKDGFGRTIAQCECSPSVRSRRLRNHPNDVQGISFPGIAR